MDLLFTRYASPFCYLDTLLEYGRFAEGVGSIWDAYEEERMWNLYLSNNPMNKKSYDDWKKEIKQKAHTQKPMSREEVEATVKKSQNILKDFVPPNKTHNKK